MSLEALLAKLEQETVTGVTECITQDLTQRTAEKQGCTLVTSVTPEKTITANESKSHDNADAQEWQYRFHERAGIIAEDTHNSLSMFAQRLAFLETLVEYLQKNHRGIIGKFKELIKPEINLKDITQD